MARAASPPRDRPDGFTSAASTLGARARSLREARGWTLEAAAAAMDIDYRQVQRIESGKANVTLATIVRIARAYGVSASSLLERPVRSVAPAGRRAGVLVVADGQASRDVVHTIGRRLAALRHGTGLTQVEVAGRADLSLQHLQRLERGSANVTIGTLLRLAAALGTDLRTLIA